MKEKFEDFVVYIVSAIALIVTAIFCAFMDFMEQDEESRYISEKIVFLLAAVIFLFLLR